MEKPDYSKVYYDLLRPSPVEQEMVNTRAIESLEHVRHLLWKERMSPIDEHRDAVNVAYKEIGRLITKLHPDPDAYWNEKWKLREANRLKVFQSACSLGGHEGDGELAHEETGTRSLGAARKLVQSAGNIYHALIGFISGRGRRSDDLGRQVH